MSIFPLLDLLPLGCWEDDPGRGLQLRRIARKEKVQREVPAPLWGKLSHMRPLAQPTHLLAERNLPFHKEDSG